MPKPRRVVAAFVAVMVVAFAGTPVVAALSGAPGIHLGKDGRLLGPQGANTTSYNWAGYAVSGPTGSATKVSGTWVEPAVTCTSQTRLAAFWVGLDGYGSTTVEQTGTLAQCSGGTASYYAWWELYPLNSVQPISTITVHPGDHFSASVTYSSSTGKFAMKITDVTTGVSFTKKASQSGTSRSSAECIVEAPGGDPDTSSGIYPLADFKTISFSSCKATMAGVSGTIGSFASVTSINIVSYPSGTRTLASTSSLTSQEAFTVTWHYAS